MAAFRLASLFRVRRIQEDRAAAELAVASGERAHMDDLTEKARKRLEGQDLPGSAESLRWQAAVAARAAASAMVTEADAARHVAASEEVVAQETWNAARAQTKTIEKLAVKHQKAEHEADMRQEQHVLDEIATQRSQKKDQE